MFPDQAAVDRPGLDDHVDSGSHRRHYLVVGPAIRSPGVAAAAAKLEAAAVDSKEDRRSVPLLAAQPDMKLTPNAEFRPVSDSDEWFPSLGSGRLDRLRNCMASAVASECAPCSEYSQRLWLSSRR